MTNNAMHAMDANNAALAAGHTFAAFRDWFANLRRARSAHPHHFAPAGRNPQREPACATCRHARGSDRMWCARPENRTANGLAAMTTEFGGCELHQPREGVRP